RLIAVNDFGYWLDARLSHEGGRLADVHSAFMLPMRDTTGQPLSGKRMSDAEGLARDRDGSLLVAFERAHRLWRYPAAALDQAAAQPVDSPLDSAGVSTNGGAEGIAVLSDGTLVVLTEGAPAGETDDGEGGAAEGAETIPG